MASNRRRVVRTNGEITGMKRSDQANLASNTKRILESPSYRIASEDPDFIKSTFGLETRVLAEYTKVERSLEAERVVSTVIVFGSARIKSPEAAKQAYDDAKAKAELAPQDAELAAELKKAEGDLKTSKYYQTAREFGELIANKSAIVNEEVNARGEIRVSRDQNMVVCTGGGPGIMEAANRGAYDAGKSTIGLNIFLPFEQAPNPFISPNLCFNFQFFPVRKQHFLQRATALAAFPGGFGTFDELFETLTLVQTGKLPQIPILLFGEDFWRKAVNFDFLIETGVISPSDLSLFHFVETAEEGWEVLVNFYEAKKNKIQ